MPTMLNAALGLENQLTMPCCRGIWRGLENNAKRMPVTPGVSRRATAYSERFAMANLASWVSSFSRVLYF